MIFKKITVRKVSDKNGGARQPPGMTIRLLLPKRHKKELIWEFQEMEKWLNQNARCRVSMPSAGKSLTFWFESQEDATAFKLRWL